MSFCNALELGSGSACGSGSGSDSACGSVSACRSGSGSPVFIWNGSGILRAQRAPRVVSRGLPGKRPRCFSSPSRRRALRLASPVGALPDSVQSREPGAPFRGETEPNHRSGEAGRGRSRISYRVAPLPRRRSTGRDRLDTSRGAGAHSRSEQDVCELVSDRFLDNPEIPSTRGPFSKPLDDLGDLRRVRTVESL